MLLPLFADVEKERACSEVGAGLSESVPDLTDLLAGHHNNNNSSPAPHGPPSVAGSHPGTPAPQHHHYMEGEYRLTTTEPIGWQRCALKHLKRYVSVTCGEQRASCMTCSAQERRGGAASASRSIAMTQGRPRSTTFHPLSARLPARRPPAPPRPASRTVYAPQWLPRWTRNAVPAGMMAPDSNTAAPGQVVHKPGS